MNFEKLVSSGKDLFALVRDLCLFILLLLLFIWPTALNSMLENSGLAEFSFMGAKWQKGLTKADASLKDANMRTEIIQGQLNAANNLLSKIKPQITDPVINREITKVEKENNQVIIASRKTQEAVKETIEANSGLVQAAEKAINADGLWGVVYSADIDLKGSEYEQTRIVKMYSLPDPRLYFRNNLYVSVSVVKSRQEAESALVRVRKSRPDAYLVSLSTWCRNSVDKGKYYQCGLAGQ